MGSTKKFTQSSILPADLIESVPLAAFASLTGLDGSPSMSHHRRPGLGARWPQLELCLTSGVRTDRLLERDWPRILVRLHLGQRTVRGTP